MRPAIAAGVLWAERIVLFAAVGICVGLAVALAAWLVVVDWQVLSG